MSQAVKKKEAAKLSNNKLKNKVVKNTTTRVDKWKIKTKRKPK